MALAPNENRAGGMLGGHLGAVEFEADCCIDGAYSVARSSRKFNRAAVISAQGMHGGADGTSTRH